MASNNQNSIADLLPGLTGSAPRNRKRRSGAGIILLALFLPALAGGGYWLYRQASSAGPEATSGTGTAGLSSMAEDLSPPASKLEVAVPDRPQEIVSEVPARPQPAPIAPPAADPAPGPTAQPVATKPEEGPAPAAEERPTSAMQRIARFMGEGKLSEARSELEKFIRADHTETEMGEAYYRIGYIDRQETKIDDACKNWKAAVEKYPRSLGGRLSAVALADILYVAACGTNPQYDKWESIRDLYSLALGEDGAPKFAPQVRSRVMSALNRLNAKLVFDNELPYSKATTYRVQSGDNLERIARMHDVSYHSIMAINSINDPRRIRVGQRLKIVKGDCKIIVDKKELNLTWYLDGKWIKQYPCCVGAGAKTPPGTYTIVAKKIKPTWRDPQSGRQYSYGEPEYALGTRWLELDENIIDGLGIHGTNKPESIPGRTSLGCIRLQNKDVEELFGFALNGSTVIIRE